MNHTIQAVAWTLIHFCWQAAAVALVYRLASIPLARRSSNARYVAALAAMLLMLAASAVTFSWEMRSTPAPIRFGAAGSGAKAGSVQPPAVVRDGYKFSPILTPVSDAYPSSGGEVSLAALLPWIDALWLLGVVALSIRSIGGWWLIQRLRASATVEAPAAAVAESFRRIAHAFELGRPVLLRVSGAIAGPLTVGALRAVVLVPLSAITSLSPEELEVVLAHELAHVRRADFLWNLIQTVIETLFFFHPAVWWIGARIRHERELCCDDLALTVCPDPLVYAHALFRLEEERGSQLRLAMALDGHQSAQTLRMRIARILGEPLTHTAKRGPFSLAAAGALLVVLLLPVPQVLAGLAPVSSPSGAASLAPHAIARPVVASVHAAASAVHAAVASVAPGLEPALSPMVAQTAPQAATQAARQEPQNSDSAAQPSTHSSGKGDYIDQMRAAGYDVDLDKLVAMKIQNITPEYARQMAQLGFGKLTADQLIAAKIQGVDADYIAQIKAAGYAVDIDKYIAMKIQGVTPEYAAKMAQLGFGKLSADDLIAAKIQDVTPEYLAELKRDGLEVHSIHDAISYRIFNVTPEFIAQMKAAGFPDLTHNQLMALRVQGVTPEYATSIRQQYPGATVDDIVKTKIFNINADFIAQAKRHGFNDLTLDKLVKLRISGILDDNDSDSK